MADNLNVTPGTGATMAADEATDGTLGSVKVPFAKIMDGTLDSTNKLIVNSSGEALVKDTAGEASLASIDGKITAVNTGAVVVSSSALPTGAATAAKQPALGTAGTPSADVITVQGVTSMTALKVDGSAVTQPVSGTVTANLGTGTADANIKQINGVTPLMGNGVTGTGSQRVTVASDNTPFAVKTDQTTHGTTDLVAADITKINGTAVSTTNGLATSNTVTAAVTDTWTTATSINTATTTVTTTGLGTVTVTSVSTGTTTTAGALTFEVYDGTIWWPISGIRMGTGLTESTYTLVNGASVMWRFGVEGYQQFRTRLSTTITGTGSPQVVLVTQASAAAIVNNPSVSVAQQLDSTNDSVSASIKGASYTKLTATGSIVSGACVYYGYTVEVSTGGTLIVYDNTSAAAPTIGSTAAVNLIAGTTNIFPVPIIATTGLYATIGGTATINFLTRGISK